MLALPAQGHEFWFEAERYQIPSGAQIYARTFNGEDFDGTELSYSARGYERTGIVGPVGDSEVFGKSGDRPSISSRPQGDGLHVVWHRAPIANITYPTMEKFTTFLTNQRLEFALDDHAARGFPTTKIKESYFRYVKLLMAVGSGEGADKPLGMTYELVALDNPYTTTGPTRFQVLGRGAPQPDVPTYVFHKAPDGSVEKLLYQTDEQGVFEVPKRPGSFLVNAVQIVPAPASITQSTGAVWVTLWASLTYGD
ncbi:MAG: DUF4198 domain-containing protein [Pseudomonadota bacterium]